MSTKRPAAGVPGAFAFSSRWMVAGILLFSIGATGGMTFVLYGTIQQVFRVSLDERLTSMAAIAALNFTPDELGQITGRASVGTPAYAEVIGKLQLLRSLAPNVQYAYILRRTGDPNTMDFVADADSLHLDVPEDINHDGKIDASDAKTYPGDPYDVSPFPEFRAAAFVRPFVDPDFTVSQWGIYISGTAPIHYPQSPTRPTDYVLALDLNVTQYQQLLQGVILPFAVFASVLLVIISLQALALRRLWNRQVRQLAEIDRQKDELIGIVSHQLASPIASVRWGLDDMLQREFGELPTAEHEHVAEMLRTVENLGELTQLLLDVSRIELGRLKMKQEPCDLDAFFDDLIALAQELARHKQVGFVYHLPTELPTAVVDQRLLRMTCENLLSNAIKYTPEAGSVTLTVEAEAGKLFAEVKDTGLGIPKADQPRIFEKLYRATNVQHVDGNGFGLYVAKGAIEQQGGRLWFTSQEGKGTTFFVELPLA